MDTVLAETATRSHPRAIRGNRDHELVSFVARHGAVAIAHVMAAMGAGRTATYRRVAACTKRGLLERLELLPGEPTLLRATPEGLRYSGLGLPTTPVSAGQVDHRLRCASTAQLLAEEFGAEHVITERELRLHERIDSEPIASARLSDGRLHRPDLVVLAEPAPIAIEVELAPKGPKRLEPIIEAWKQATWVSEVRYYAEPGTTRRGLERAIPKLDASSRIRLFDVPARNP
jgi:hypothetical protein